MSDRLDALIDRLAGSPLDRPLGEFETQIGRIIARRRRDLKVTAQLAPVWIASIALALAIGVTAGGAVAASAVMRRQPLGVLSSSAHLAPSSLLEASQ